MKYYADIRTVKYNETILYRKADLLPNNSGLNFQIKVKDIEVADVVCVKIFRLFFRGRRKKIHSNCFRLTDFGPKLVVAYPDGA